MTYNNSIYIQEQNAYNIEKNKSQRLNYLSFRGRSVNAHNNGVISFIRFQSHLETKVLHTITTITKKNM